MSKANQQYVKQALGGLVVILSVVGVVIIQDDNIYSFSQMFIVYRYFFAWVLMSIGIALCWLRVEVGIGFLGLAIFYEGDVHNYIMSPLMVVTMAWYYVRMGSFWWLTLQVVVGIVQGYLYVGAEDLAADYFYLTEAIGFAIGGLYFLLRGDKGRDKYFNFAKRGQQ